MAEERSTGTVKWFNDTKGFGFITPDDKTGDARSDSTALDRGEGEVVSTKSPSAKTENQGPQSHMSKGLISAGEEGELRSVRRPWRR